MKWVALIIILMATAIIQWHGMMFWTEHAGVTGWGWSIVLEAAALWLWWQPQWHIRTIGMLGTIIVLAGPMYQISEPVVKAWKSNAANQQEIVTLTHNLTVLNVQLSQFLDNSKKRTGWLTPINRTQDNIFSTQARINDLTRQSGTKTGWETIALVLVELFALIIITTAQISSVRWLATHRPAPRRPAKRKSTTSESRKKKEIKNTHTATLKKEPKKIIEPIAEPLRLVENMMTSNDQILIKNWVDSQVRLFKTKSDLAESLGIDRRELGCVMMGGGRKAKKETWNHLSHIMRQDKKLMEN